jgi:hypothetical protein
MPSWSRRRSGSGTIRWKESVAALPAARLAREIGPEIVSYLRAEAQRGVKIGV